MEIQAKVGGNSQAKRVPIQETGSEVRIQAKVGNSWTVKG